MAAVVVVWLVALVVVVVVRRDDRGGDAAASSATAVVPAPTEPPTADEIVDMVEVEVGFTPGEVVACDNPAGRRQASSRPPSCVHPSTGR